jgi:hypothetical protein
VIDMNRRLGGDVSLNAPMREEGDSGEWQDWLLDESADQETRLAESQESDNRRKALASALFVLNERERRIFEARRLAEDPTTLAELADEFGLCRERVRQIEVSSFEKVQNAVKNRVAASKLPRPVERGEPESTITAGRRSTVARQVGPPQGQVFVCEPRLVSWGGLRTSLRRGSRHAQVAAASEEWEASR